MASNDRDAIAKTVFADRPVVFPLGIVLPYAGETVSVVDVGELERRGWYLCDGSPRTRRLPLFAVIGTIYGKGDDVETFNLPDYRGRFLRAVDDPTGSNPANNDPDAKDRAGTNGGAEGNRVGSIQKDELSAHSHGYQHPYGGGVPHMATGSEDGRNEKTTAVGGNETRPKNIYVNFIIFGGVDPGS